MSRPSRTPRIGCSFLIEATRQGERRQAPSAICGHGLSVDQSPLFARHGQLLDTGRYRRRSKPNSATRWWDSGRCPRQAAVWIEASPVSTLNACSGAEGKLDFANFPGRCAGLLWLQAVFQLADSQTQAAPDNSRPRQERFRAFAGKQGLNALVNLALDLAHRQPARNTGRQRAPNSGARSTEVDAGSSSGMTCKAVNSRAKMASWLR